MALLGTPEIRGHSRLGTLNKDHNLPSLKWVYRRRQVWNAGVEVKKFEIQKNTLPLMLRLVARGWMRLPMSGSIYVNSTRPESESGP